MTTVQGTPRTVAVARTIMFVQAVASLLVWVAQLRTTTIRMEHGQTIVGPAVLVDIVNPVIAILVAVAAIFLVTHPAWAQPLAIAMESIGMIGAVISIFTGFYQAAVAIVMAVAVIVLIRRS